jgi:hypothetical protein
LNRVDLDSLKKIRLGVTHDSDIIGTKAPREVTDRHTSPVNFAIVPAEEEIHVLGITDQSLINRAGACDTGKQIALINVKQKINSPDPEMEPVKSGKA